MDIETQLAQYAAKLQVASMKARIWSVCAIAAIWLVFPVAVANFIRPQFGVKVQGAFLSQPQVACVIVFLLAIQLSNTIGFYRRAALAGQWVGLPSLAHRCHSNRRDRQHGLVDLDGILRCGRVFHRFFVSRWNNRLRTHLRASGPQIRVRGHEELLRRTKRHLVITRRKTQWPFWISSARIELT